MVPRRSTRKSAAGVANGNDVAAITPTQALNDSPMNSHVDPSLSKKRTRSSRTAVPNSSDNDDDIVGVDPSMPPVQLRRTLKQVSIPVMSTGHAAASVTAQSAESENSNESPSLDNSDYDTPATSKSNTPAASFGRTRGSARKSGLSKTVTARSRNTIEDTDDEIEAVDLDAELALQMQLEEDEGEHRSKRQRIEESDDEDDEVKNAYAPPARARAKPTPYKGKGKGKAKVESDIETDDDADSLLEELVSEPSYEGKGKGKAANEELSHRRSRSNRPSMSRNTILDDIISDLEDSEEYDEFKPDDAGSAMDDVDSLAADDSEEEEPLMVASARFKKVSAKLPKRARGKKSFTHAEKMEKQRRMARYAHIEDKWERKRAMNRERAEQQHPKLRSMWDDLQKIPVLPVERAEQPKTITRRLKPFQLEGLSWMIRQEQTHYRGGLLGDEMGMGKTIQAVSLIMSDYPAKAPTLVCVPPVALMQWSNEIREYTENKLNVLVYHGTNAKCKKMTVKDLKKFDVIMVSYNSLESLHRKETKGWSRGEDIIKEASPLHAIHFHRLILDEAHSIKSRNTGVAKACFALTGTYKWCLSGTPVQNRIGEFFSLLRFLEVRPFADYFCRSCKCEKLHWATDDDHMCVACNHGASEHISVFNQELLNPITGDDVDLREQALAKLHMITARIMLRRMKRDHTNSMELPMKDIIIHNEFFSEVERDFSTSIMSNSNRKFDTYVAQGVMLNNYANIFGLIMQMRQVANHPDLLLKKNAAEGSQNVYVCNICDEPAEDAIRSHCRHEFCRACVKDYMDTCEASGTDADCPRCHIALTIDFEQPELEQDIDSVKKTSIINRIKMENWTSSTKIEMLVYDLYKLRSKKQTLKSIVFSQFTSMLQLIEWRLRRAGFNTVMLDGSMTPAMRQKSIDHFMTNPDVEVFLVSLKAGGVALNLTEASRVFIVDPWWNPAAEWQSADRCHRIGQKRPCVITRLCIEDSVESRMVALQEKKAAMIAGTVNNDKVAMDRLSPEDLQFLFRGS
ncbi:DNA repair protein rad16 [Ascochyta rabiei]|uniref:ATP binding n=1 Tax=Didymella rabiei TaxID=5454 RepID=A0A163EET7_DIDRA|nr:DNA repair protein rad16 [Ascochyta rabiei]KZM23662.1 ATP binding [Ascochyta rabiei]UPX12270.1 DNA repair protein rad16 [Ascochyta rabiei]